MRSGVKPTRDTEMAIGVPLGKNEDDQCDVPQIDPKTLGRRKSKFFQGFLNKCYSTIPEFDPVLQVMLVQVAEKIRQGKIVDRHMIFLAGAIILVVIEELI